MKNTENVSNINNTKRIAITIISLSALVLLFYLVSSAITKYTGYSITDKVLDKEEEFKTCLQEKDITLYINANNPQETLKNIQVNDYDYLDSIKIFNCQTNNEDCIQKGINGPFPAWIINNNKIDSDVSLAQLKELSGCSLE